MTEVYWTVLDTNATKGPRLHQVGDKTYPLQAEARVEMPQAHATMFLRDPSFHVWDENDERVFSIAKQAVSVAGYVAPKLDPGQVIANLSELTQSSLLVRASQYPDGKEFSTRTKRLDLEAFLIAKAGTSTRDAKAMAAGEAAAGEDIDDVDETEVAKLFEQA